MAQIPAEVEPSPFGLLARRGILFVVSGPSGVGKDAVLHAYAGNPAAPDRGVTTTTRLPRPGEQAGVDYHFLSPEEFANLRAAGGFLESAEVHGHWYGTPRAWIEERLQTGRDVIVNIDVQGARSIRAAKPDAATIFLLPPSWEELERRLRLRATDAEEEIQRRLVNARGELAERDHYRYWVVNDVVQEAVASLAAIVTAERCRADRWRPLSA